MGLAERVADLEVEVAHLRAVVDGGEAQAREAIVVAIGLLASFAAESGALDLDRLIEFLPNLGVTGPDQEDRTGMLLHGIGLVLAYHRDLRAGTCAPPNASPRLTGDEGRMILRRARAITAFDLAVDEPAGGATRLGRGPLGH